MTPERHDREEFSHPDDGSGERERPVWEERLRNELNQLVARDGEIALIIDLSTICRVGADAHFRPLQRALQAWYRQQGQTRVVAIADSNLEGRMGSRDQKLYRCAQRWGEGIDPPFIHEEPDADPEVLRLARENPGAKVLSGDSYSGKRREHPWLQGLEGRFLSYEGDGGDGAELIERRLGSPGSFSKSQGEAADELKLRQVPDKSPILRYHWRCTNSTCALQKLSPERLLTTPLVLRGTARCPRCNGKLVQAEMRAESRFVKLTFAGKVERFPVEVGQDLVFGRDSPVPLDVFAPDQADGVREELLKFRYDGEKKQVYVSLISSGPVEIRDSNDRSRPMKEGEETGFNKGDVIAVARSLELKLSGNNALVPRRSG